MCEPLRQGTPQGLPLSFIGRVTCNLMSYMNFKIKERKFLHTSQILPPCKKKSVTFYWIKIQSTLAVIWSELNTPPHCFSCNSYQSAQKKGNKKYQPTHTSERSWFDVVSTSIQRPSNVMYRLRLHQYSGNINKAS